MVLLHFIKREYESVYVHRFRYGECDACDDDSNDTMPLRNLPKNCFHYWILSGLFIAYYLYHPSYTAVRTTSTARLMMFVFLVRLMICDMCRHE